MKSLLITFLLVAAGCCMSGCGSIGNGFSRDLPGERHIMNLNHQAADHLLAQMGRHWVLIDDRRVNVHHTIVVATFVDANNVRKSSPFGRIASEEISGRIANRGYRVIDVKLTPTLKLGSPPAKSRNAAAYDAGEFFLSRDASDLGRKSAPSAVITGTYVRTDNGYMVSLKATDPLNSEVLAAYNYVCPAFD